MTEQRRSVRPVARSGAGHVLRRRHGCGTYPAAAGNAKALLIPTRRWPTRGTALTYSISSARRHGLARPSRRDRRLARRPAPAGVAGCGRGVPGVHRWAKRNRPARRSSEPGRRPHHEQGPRADRRADGVPHRQPCVIAEMGEANLPYQMSADNQLVGLAALHHTDAYRPLIARIVAERARLAEALAKTGGVVPWPSEGNFIPFRTPLPAGLVQVRLADRGILISDISRTVGQRWLRVTVGTRRKMTSSSSRWPTCSPIQGSWRAARISRRPAAP